MSISVRENFIIFANTRKHMLLYQYPNATAQEIVSLMLKEFSELTLLPPPYLTSSPTPPLERAFEPLTISGLLFVKK